MFYIYYLAMFFGMGVLFTFLPVYFNTETIMRPEQVTMMMSFAPIVSFISSNIFAYLSDKTRRYKLIISVAMVASITTSLLITFLSKSDTVILIIIGYFLFAFFYPAVGSLSENFTLQFAKIKNMPYGRIRLFGSLGYAIAGQVAGLLTNQFGLVVIFYVFALCTLIPLLIVPSFKEIDVEEEAHDELVDGDVEDTKVYKQLLGNKRFVTIMAVSFLILGSINAMNTFLGIYIISFTEMDLSFLGTLVLLSAGTEIPMMFFSNKLIDKFGVFKILSLSAILNVIRFATYVLFPFKLPIILVTLTHGIGYGAAFTSVMHLIQNNVSVKVRASAISLNQSFAVGIGTFLITFLGSNFFNARSIFGALAVLELIGAVLCIYLISKKYD